MAQKKSRKLKYLLHDIADALSANETIANNSFLEEGVNIEKYVKKGLEEINEWNIQSIKKKDSNSEPNIYFKRVVLAAKIASELHNEFTFGHVKFQKLVFLCEKAANLDLRNRYSKQAAGPFDAKFMHSIDQEFENQGWFNVELKKGKYTKYVYTPIEGDNKYNDYFKGMYGKCSNSIFWVINTFRKTKTKEVELIATVYACWEEIIENRITFSEEKLVELFFKWSEEKKKFTSQEIVGAISWMRENDFSPSQKI